MADFFYNTDNILCNFPLCLRKNIEELCLRSQMGLGSINLPDISIPSNRYTTDENYHFIVKIPYAGKQLKWELIFDPENFCFAPDFDFNDEQFLNNPDYETIANNIPTLADWNLKDPKALSQVLNEFLSLYKKLQIEKLLQENIYSRFCEEYQILVSDEYGVKAENVEVCIDSTSVHFLIALKADCTSLAEYIQPLDKDQSVLYNPGEDFAHLKVMFLRLDGSRSNISLQLSPRLEQMLGNPRNWTIPDYKREAPLLEHVLKVSQIIEARIELKVEHFKLKKIYTLNLVAACCRCIVEYDSETFDKVVFLYNVNDYSCLVTVTVGPKFPQEKPVVQLTSIYCQEGKHCNENVDKYPYNPDAQPDENIEALLAYIPEATLRLKNHKH